MSFKPQIIERLKAKFSGVNLSKERVDAIADKLGIIVTEEDQIDAKLDELNSIISFADIAKQDDKIRTLEAKTKAEPPKQDSPKAEDTPPKAEDVPAWAKELMQTVTSLKTEKVASSRKELVAAKLKDADDKYRSKVLRDFDRMKIETDEDFNRILQDVETDFSEYKQAVTNSGLGNDRPFGGIGGNGKVKEATDDDYNRVFGK